MHLPSPDPEALLRYPLGMVVVSQEALYPVSSLLVLPAWAVWRVQQVVLLGRTLLGHSQIHQPWSLPSQEICLECRLLHQEISPVASGPMTAPSRLCLFDPTMFAQRVQPLVTPAQSVRRARKLHRLSRCPLHPLHQWRYLRKASLQSQRHQIHFLPALCLSRLYQNVHKLHHLCVQGQSQHQVSLTTITQGRSSRQ